MGAAGILQGMRIVEGSAFVAMPYGGMTLAQMGADGPTVFPRPVNHLLPAWDCIAGQMAMVGLLAAERHRRLTGEGQVVRLALKDVALAMLGHLGKIAEVMVNDGDRPKDGNYLYDGEGGARKDRRPRGRRDAVTALRPSPCR
jgi:crotonobetainyl-CoA:carnitine CoA-transferase CaiB-like acyl-CoA transferase